MNCWVHVSLQLHLLKSLSILLSNALTFNHSYSWIISYSWSCYTYFKLLLRLAFLLSYRCVQETQRKWNWVVMLSWRQQWTRIKITCLLGREEIYINHLQTSISDLYCGIWFFPRDILKYISNIFLCLVAVLCLPSSLPQENLLQSQYPCAGISRGPSGDPPAIGL